MDSLPSSLDSPRFFDDNPLSVWHQGEERFLASKQEVEAKALAYSASDNRAFLPPKDSLDPISIEIVRGSNGADDEGWTVLVDGIRYKRLPPILQDDEDVFRCVLPPGIRLPSEDTTEEDKRLSVRSKVRPVVLGIRLEEEAIFPANATLFVEQILDTSERKVQNKNVPEVSLLHTVDLRPYRVSEVQSNVVTMQYPFWAPAQSVLGILSLDAFTRWKEDSALANAWNFVAPVVTTAAKVAYTLQSKQFVKDTKAQTLFRSTNDLVARKLLKPKMPKALKITSVPEAPSEGSAKTFRIGGLSKSSARELGSLFETLTDACENARLSGDGPPLYDAQQDISIDQIQEQIRGMEAYLVGNGHTKALALLRALLTTDIKEEVKQLLKPGTIKTGVGSSGLLDPSLQFRYAFNPDTNTFSLAEESGLDSSNFGIVASVIGQSNEQKSMKDLKAPYAFTYERLSWARRDLTTVRTRLRVKIEDHQNHRPFVVEFVSSRDDGIAAHAVYSGVCEDIEYMDEQACNFMDCLLGPYMGAGLNANTRIQPTAQKKATKRPATLKAVLRKASKEGARSILREMTGLNAATNIGEIETRIAELRIMIREILPIWPPINVVDALQDLDENSQEFQEQIAAIRLQSVSSSADKELTEVDKIEIQEEVLLRAFTSVGALASTEGNEIDKNIELEMQKEADEMLREQNVAIQEQDKGDEYTSTYTGDKNLLILSRELPQIVKPATVLLYSFKTPDSVDPPALYVLWNEETATATYSLMQGLGLVGTVGGKVVKYTPIIASVYALYILGQYSSVTAFAQASKAFISSILSAISGPLSSAPGKLYNWFVNSRIGQVSEIIARIKLMVDFTGITRTLQNSISNSTMKRIEVNDALREAYQEHAKKERGVPVNEAFASARAAVDNWKKSEKRRLQSMGVGLDASVVYNPATGHRFRFREHYEAASRVGTSKPFFNMSDWEGLPDSNSLHILPPADADQAFFETAKLRSIPLEETVLFVAGSHGRGLLTQWMGSPAHAAFKELARLVVNSLKAMHNGQRIEKSPSDIALELVEHGSAVLRLVYGTPAGVSLVSPDDVLWGCLRSGTFARIAIRHLAIFNSSPVLEANGEDFVKTSIYFWQKSNRLIVDAFVTALLYEAKEYKKVESKQLFVKMTHEMAMEEKKQLVSRIQTLSYNKLPGEARAIKLAVEATLVDATGRVPFSSHGCDHGETVIVHNYDALLQETHDKPFDQSALNPQTVMVKDEGAVWASRRMDTSLCRSICIGHGPESVINALSSIDLSGNSRTGNMIFYCPVGSRLDALPGSKPFVTESINQRVVWTEYVESAAQLLLRGLSDKASHNGDWNVKASYLKDRHHVTGIARHPIAILLNGQQVDVGLSTRVGVDSHGPTSERVVLMRRRVFNTDRLFFALSLAYSYMESPDIHVSVPTEEVGCMALAVAVRCIEGGLKDVNIILHAESVPKAQEILVNLRIQAQKSRAQGCKVCLLSEMALCM